MIATRIWTAENLAAEAEANLHQARLLNQMAPANKAVEILARLTGNLEAPKLATDTKITTIEIHLDSGVRGQVIDVEEYTVAPGPDEGKGADSDRITH